MPLRFQVILFILCLSGSLRGQQLNYRHFTMEDGLSQMKINSLVCDSIGNIWIGTRNGLNKFNGASFTIFNTEDGILHERIHQLSINNKNEIVALTYGGISIFNGSKFNNYPRDFIYVLYEIAIDQRDNVWIYDRSKLELTYLVNGKYHLLDDSMINGGKVMGISSHEVDNKVFIGTSNGIYEVIWKKDLTLKLVNDTPVDHADPSRHLGGLPLFATETTSETKIGEILINDNLFPGYEIYKSYDPPRIITSDDGDVWVKYFSQAAIPLSGSSVVTDEFNQVNAMIRDQQDQIWLGTEIGLIQIFNDQFQSESNEKFPYVWSVIEDDSGNIWTSSFGKGIKFYAQGKDPISIKSPTFKNNSFLAASVKDDSGNIYFGHASDLYKWDGQTFSSIFSESTFTLAYDYQQNILIAGVENGFYRIMDDIILDTIDHHDGMHNCHYIQALEIDKNGNYWAGSYTGLSKYDNKYGTVTNYTSNSHSLLSKGVYEILSDQEGNLWMGGESGLIYYEENLDTFIILKSAILNTIVKSIIEIGQDHLLIGAKDGLYIFDKRRYLETDEVRFQIYNNTNGYNGIEPGFSGLYADSKDKIWITSATDLVSFNSKNLLPSDQTLRSQITHINGQRIKLNHSMGFIDTFHNEDINIDFEAVGSVRPSKIKYQYQLNSEGWSNWSEDNSVVLNNLNSGEYNFQIRSGPTDFKINPNQVDQVNFVVKVPFYRSSWFPPIAISLILIGIGSAIFYYVLSLQERNKYLKSISEANYLRSQLLLSELNPHFIFNVLASIQSKILNNQPRQASDYIVRLSRLIRNFLEASYKGNSPDTSISDHDILLSKEIELIESFVLFEQDKSNQHFDYEIIIDPNLDIENTFIPPMLIQPFVENAIKHGLLPKGNDSLLSIHFQQFKEGLRCTIKDNGIGIKANKKNDYTAHVSLGSRIVKERIDILKEVGYDIDLDIKENSTGGTQVTLSILDER
ncbi:MAG: histidine kinase [Saprospiraceae bacterium]|nr:histidine kinase [Saprospiraceae bacterium]